MPTYSRSTTVDATAGGDTVKQAVLDLDTDLTQAFADITTVSGESAAVAADLASHEADTTTAHGATGGIVGVTATQTLTNKTLTAPTITLPTFTGIKETKGAMAAWDINLALGTAFAKTITTNSTFTVSNVPASGLVGAFTLNLTNGGTGTITWFSGVKWAGGIAPTLTISGRDRLGFITEDGGTTWDGFLLGADLR